MQPTKKSSSSTAMSLKLLIEKSQRRVLFAEAGKDFVDFLFGLLQLPVGAILRLLAESGAVPSWSIAKVYESVQSMDSNYMQPNQSKISLLCPKSRPSNTKQTPMLEQFECTETERQPAFSVSSAPSFSVISAPAFSFSSAPAFASSSLFGSSSPSVFGGSTSSAVFGSSCGLSTEPTVVHGYVKEIVTYTVMDDLTVKPMSAISTISILNTFQVSKVEDLEWKIIEIGMEMALKLVKAAFESTTVLTDVFLRGEEIDIPAAMGMI